LNFIGSRVLFDMQKGDPRKLIRGDRRPLFFPWRPTPRPETGKVVFIATASDLNWWRPIDVTVLEAAKAPVRLVRPGTMTQQELLALPPTADCYWLDVWCGDEEVRKQLLEVMLPLLPTINDFVM
jgi:hypothetical protein